VFHFRNRSAKTIEYGSGNDRVTDIQFGKFLDRRHWHDIVIMQTVARMYRQTQIGRLRRGGNQSLQLPGSCFFAAIRVSPGV